MLPSKINTTTGSVSSRRAFCRLVRIPDKLTDKQARFLGYYVYAIVDPRDGAVFYVGKGRGGRCYVHEKKAERGNGHNPALDLRIVEIHAAGARPSVVCLAEGLTEAQAFEREAAEIQARAGLCNVSSGTRTWQERQRARAKALIRRFKSIRDVSGVEAQRWHRLCLKQLARLVAHPEPHEWVLKS